MGQLGMNKEDIIRLARRAGLEILSLDGEDEVGCGDGYHIQTDLIERFAALVAAQEREECAKVCEELKLRSADGQLGTYIAGWSDGTDDCAAAIRSRT